MVAEAVGAAVRSMIRRNELYATKGRLALALVLRDFASDLIDQCNADVRDITAAIRYLEQRAAFEESDQKKDASPPE